MNVISPSSSPSPDPSILTHGMRAHPNSSSRPPEVIVILDSSDDEGGFGTATQNRVKSAASRRNKGKAKVKGMPGSPFLPIPIHHVSHSLTAHAGPSRVRRKSRASNVGANATAQALADSTNTAAKSTITTAMATPTVATPIKAPTPIPMDVDHPPAPLSLDDYLILVLEIVPDVDPQFATELITMYVKQRLPNVVELVVHHLLESPTYPRISKNKGKRKRSDSDVDEAAQFHAQPEKSARVDYASKDRPFKGGIHYRDLALGQLYDDFSTIPKLHIQKTFQQCNWLYAPTHITLSEQLKSDSPPFKAKVTPTRRDNKGKCHDAEFAREREWLLEYLEENSDGECEDGIECGCCFSKYKFDKMAQCPDAHLFCKSCLISFVENRIGEGNLKMQCMDLSGCNHLFSDTELARVLTPKLLALYHRMQQVKEVEAAGISGLESCPFCDYRVVIENPDEKLFKCANDECSAVSCRECKKVDHLPKNCQEAEEDKGLDARHRIEEAMTKALMRECPKCKQPFIKVQGCNKMACTNCKTVSCYVCRKAIDDGYNHFESDRSKKNSTKCQLWDVVEKRHDEEVEEARKHAIEEVRRENPNVDERDLNVELPKTAPTVNANGPEDIHRRRFGFPAMPNPFGMIPPPRVPEVHVHVPHAQPVHVLYGNLIQQPQQQPHHNHVLNAHAIPAPLHEHRNVQANQANPVAPLFGQIDFRPFNFQPPLAAPRLANPPAVLPPPPPPPQYHQLTQAMALRNLALARQRQPQPPPQPIRPNAQANVLLAARAQAARARIEELERQIVDIRRNRDAFQGLGEHPHYPAMVMGPRLNVAQAIDVNGLRAEVAQHVSVQQPVGATGGRGRRTHGQ